MTYLKVINDCHTHSEREDREWGSWSEDTHNDVNGLQIVEEKDYYDLIADFDVKVKDFVYLVYATYSTGDSFGHGTGCIEYIAVFKTEEKAARLKKMLQKRDQGDKNENKFTFKYTTESGKKIENHCPWDGYFESLESVYVEELEIYDIMPG